MARYGKDFINLDNIRDLALLAESPQIPFTIWRLRELIRRGATLNGLWAQQRARRRPKLNYRCCG